MLSKSSLVALAIVALAVHSSQAAVAQPLQQHDSCRKTTVAVLGGGMAGIAAAQALSNASISDFLILEYQDRIGGRAHHTTFGAKEDGSPYTVELGANWISGLARPGGPENPVWTLAKKYRLENTYSNYKSILTYNETGYTDYSHLLGTFEEAHGRMNVEAAKLLVENLQDQSVRSGLGLAGWSPKHGDMAAQAIEYWSWDFEAAYPPEESSMIFGAASDSLTLAKFSDENNFVIDPRGFSSIITGEASSFLQPDDQRLLLRNKVANISHSDSGVTVYADDGSCVSAAYAICTFSLGVLQSDVVQFSPELPKWKETAIRKFSMGTYSKIFFQFNETFWPQDTQYLLYASPTTRGYYTLWQSLSTEGFLPGSNIIFVTVTHDESYRIEQQSDEETKQEALEVLRDMFPDKTIPEPTAFMYPRWTKTPWAFGSYSNWPIGTTLEMHQNLRANVGRLWFAGEAASAQYFGFLHGAWFEGREAGAQVAGLVQDRCVKLDDGPEQCGPRTHYEELHGTSPLEHYTWRNGWANRGVLVSKSEG
ncbi:flavin containing amine oxidoreductase [Hirsutella rhossiliensis]|uniref:Amine oxidase n=1 Tax=Hirsutella rhossiliensis TaxID=111463 RepID=A0A9P8SIB6_9HYPO|nr:flavin containing amine oxidoreductase domain-containing protein [Hirsutella rhossiliensis]KAH0963721.1 flavin containing amine oxidoreductase domain-containing protein [Hirsutella rhossiliensis]